MQRLATSLGIVIALLAIAPAAEAGSYSFSIGGHRFHVEAPRHCRSASCVSVSSNRSIRSTEDAGATSAPPAPAAVAPPANVVIPVRPTTGVVPSPAPVAPVMAATTSQPVVLPPVTKPEAARPEAARPEAPSPHPPRVELPRIDAPKTATFDPPRIALPAPSSEIKPTAAAAQRNDDEQAYTPLGEWESTGAKGTVRIERCGPALCGYALTEALSRGESVLVNMKPKSHDAWTGSIYSRSSGNTYYATMTLKGSGRLHVEACAFWRFWCSGNDWTRVETPHEQLITTSRQWSARS